MKHEHIGPGRRLERLSRLHEFEVDKHYTDWRGWKVVNSEGAAIGEVEDLIVDTARMKATYLEVELNAKTFQLRDDPHIMVPMSRAQRDGDHRRLIVAGLTRERVADLFAARDEHLARFWERWWETDRTPSAVGDSSPSTSRAATKDLRLALDDVKPGEEIRIPIVNEEIVIERRPVHADERAVAREADTQPPPARGPATND